MKRPLAYITAAWSGEHEKDGQRAAGYFRAVYEAGFSPLCPVLYLPLILNDAIPEAASTWAATCFGGLMSL